MEISAEQLAYWYLRLNGFLTIQNFIVHPDTGRDQRTDADILGIRFPFRAELKPNPMEDEPLFTQIVDKPFIIIAEVKKSECRLNGPWTAQEEENLPRVLRAIGAFPEDQIEAVAKAIYTSGSYFDSKYHITLACFGKFPNQEIKRDFPLVPQILWNDVLAFIYNRFKKYRYQKISHGQWSREGQNLWECSSSSKRFTDFESSITITGG